MTRSVDKSRSRRSRALPELSTATRWRFAGHMCVCMASTPRRARSVAALEARFGRAVVRLPGRFPAASARVTVACEGRDQDRYGRVVGVCWVGGEDVNAWMVAAGWAFAYRKYSVRYVAEEMAAKAAKRGVWGGDMVAPWDWRRGKRLVHTGTTATESGRCSIKGNISTGGERIYHVPGGRFYDQTRIDTSRGERWFCSEAEAQGGGMATRTSVAEGARSRPFSARLVS